MHEQHLTNEQQATVKELARVVFGLQRGKVTPDEVRSVMRVSREQHGEQTHLALHARAIARFDKAHS